LPLALSLVVPHFIRSLATSGSRVSALRSQPSVGLQHGRLQSPSHRALRSAAQSIRQKLLEANTTYQVVNVSPSSPPSAALHLDRELYLGHASLSRNLTSVVRRVVSDGRLTQLRPWGPRPICFETFRPGWALSGQGCVDWPILLCHQPAAQDRGPPSL
jgi:hypothetical protein